jgi:hypothetical protein
MTITTEELQQSYQNCKKTTEEVNAYIRQLAVEKAEAEAEEAEAKAEEAATRARMLSEGIRRAKLEQEATPRANRQLSPEDAQRELPENLPEELLRNLFGPGSDPEKANALGLTNKPRYLALKAEWDRRKALGPRTILESAVTGTIPLEVLDSVFGPKADGNLATWLGNLSKQRYRELRDEYSSRVAERDRRKVGAANYGNIMFKNN